MPNSSNFFAKPPDALQRYRNSLHSCGMTQMASTSRKTIINCFTRQSGMTALTKTVAFTLAETLVVMGIIGVVAALTIPNLNQSTGDREKVAKVKKVYSNLEDAFGRAQAVYGPFDEWFQNDGDNKAKTKRFAERMIEFMKVSKNCGQDESGCFASSNVTYYDGDDVDNVSYDDHPNNEYNVILADGTSVLFCMFYGSGKIRVDIDGPNKGKNVQGIDIFDFSIYDDDEGNDIMIPSAVPTSWTGDVSNMWWEYTTAWIIQNGNMDYLKCPDDLNWETKTSCK